MAWTGPIKVLNTLKEMEAATNALLEEAKSPGLVLGFDTETRPSFKKVQHPCP